MKLDGQYEWVDKCDICGCVVLIKDTHLMIQENSMGIKTGKRVCVSCYRDGRLSKLGI